TKVSLKSLEETECTNDHLPKFSRFCDPWNFIGSHLKLPDTKLNAIDGDHNTVEEKRLAVLKEWKQICAFRATYLVLVQALMDANKIQNAVELCEWFKKNVMTHGE
ncbi:MAG: death domain-containing protein, partial [Proteobacteria bacterium]|nr:death domain-containing protein [Pseudomonadota bacterium]